MSSIAYLTVKLYQLCILLYELLYQLYILLYELFFTGCRCFGFPLSKYSLRGLASSGITMSRSAQCVRLCTSLERNEFSKFRSHEIFLCSMGKCSNLDSMLFRAAVFFNLLSTKSVFVFGVSINALVTEFMDAVEGISRGTVSSLLMYGFNMLM